MKDDNSYWVRVIRENHQELELFGFPKGKKPGETHVENDKDRIVHIPITSAPDPTFAVDYYVPPWLLFWFGGPELQSLNGTTSDEEVDAIGRFKNAIVVSLNEQMMHSAGWHWTNLAVATIS